MHPAPYGTRLGLEGGVGEGGGGGGTQTLRVLVAFGKIDSSVGGKWKVDSKNIYISTVPVDLP